MSKDDGMNRFLCNLGITIRQDPETMRPRINKFNSQLDTEQKHLKMYYMKTTAKTE
jgi:ATP-binding cassette, sub-family E, member 1